MPDPAFAPFTAQHGVAVAVGFGLIALCLVLGRRGGRTELVVRAILAFLCLSASAFGAWAWSRVGREISVDNYLPLHLCDLAAFLGGFALITRKPILCLLTYFWGLAGTLQGIATPAIDIGWPHPAFLAFFTAHFAVIAAALYLPVVMGWRAERPWWKSPLKAFAWLNAYVVVAIAANALLDSNFGFLAGKPLNPSLLDHLGPHPFYILWLEALALAFFALLTLPVMKRRKSIERTRE
ncbi:TIGR02206 family membrane protein [Haloferula sp. A504]|uniref:YwaF family protein n=1 Tax=Haloferula sp. A504 TaxID=3373601 RepID=UPI0031BE871C|nr:TIGR02206 family membrane protein [Verrucomicrobiaceae bacterium E54]